MNAKIEQYINQVIGIDRSSGQHVYPVMDKILVVDIVHECNSVFKREPQLIQISGDYNIIGDIHGHLGDLVRVLKICGLPPSSKFLFLGDIVDRGENSLECILLVYCLKILFPDHVFIIRGNHEYRDLCSNYGFLDEIKKSYNDEDLHNVFLESFSNMSFAAIHDTRVLFLHGGIGPKFRNLGDLNSVAKPHNEFYGGIPDEIVWSDPSPNVPHFKESERGNGYLFGESPFLEFLKNNDIRYLIRGHQSPVNGYEYAFNGKLITVHTASNYMKTVPNKSGYIKISNAGEIDCKSEPPIIKPQQIDSTIHRRNTQPAIGVSPSVKKTLPTQLSKNRFNYSFG